MSIQTKYSLLFTFLICVLIVCAIKAFRSDKKVSKTVGKFELAIILPVLANILILNSHVDLVSRFGYYLYYIGMTVVMMALVSFINKYCQDIDEEQKERKPTVMYILGLIDIIQIVLGLIFKHVFDIEQTILGHKIYYKPIPHIGLYLHRIIDYIIFFCILLILILSIVKSSKIYREKFVLIFVALVFSGLTQAHFIILRTNVDLSVVFHSILGIIIFYFAIYYTPLKLLDRMLSNLASDLDDSIFMFDASGKCIWANDNGHKLLNVDRNDQVMPKLINAFGDIRNQGDNWSKDVKLERENDTRYLTLTKKSVISNNINLDGSFLIIKDATERYLKIQMEMYQANHDSLTDLYNKKHLYEIIELVLNQNPDKDYYVVYINIKNFKIVNDIFGNKMGDDVLIRLANWLRQNLSKNCVYGRLIGDTFGILVPKEDFYSSIYEEKLSNFVIGNGQIEHHIFFHVGIYEIKNKKMDIAVMFDRAHLALSNITDEYTTCIRFYDDDLRQKVIKEQQIVSELHKAINEDQIVPYLQPITNVNGTVVGAEALARWIHPEKGFMSPAEFIPVFEKNGMIADVDKHIWEKVCQLLAKWKKEGKNLFISINISPKDFYFIDVIDEIQNLVKKYNIDTKKLRIEITETALIDDSKERTKIFESFRNLGFIVEMDDFGSGYSSLNMLKDVPIDVLKIDMKFLSSNNQRSKIIVKNIINLSGDLNVTALTEGVETKQQFNQLVDMGCTLFQGYYFAKPMPIEEFETFVDSASEVK